MKRRDFSIWLAGALTAAPPFLTLPSAQASESSMTTGTIPGYSKALSHLVQGTAPVVDSSFWHDYLDGVQRLGCNTFDTAREYGNGASEEGLGAWMAVRRNRQALTIISKGGHHVGAQPRLTKKDLEKDLAQSLKALRTDYIDLYLLHRDDTTSEVGAVLEWLHEFKKQGKILACGCSNWSWQRIAQAQTFAQKNSLTEFSLSSPQWSLTEWQVPPWPGTYSISGAAGKKDRQWYREHKFPVMAWSSLSGGALDPRFRKKINALTGYDAVVSKTYGGPRNFERYDRAQRLAKKKNRSVYDIALAYLFSHSLPTFAIVGTSKVEHFRSNLSALHFKLSAQEISWLDLESDSINL